jgi:hypothetical protein
MSDLGGKSTPADHAIETPNAIRDARQADVRPAADRREDDRLREMA